MFLLNRKLKELKADHELELKKLTHENKLTLAEAKAEFAREKRNWEQDKLKFQKDLEDSFTRKEAELVALAKIAAEKDKQKIEAVYQEKMSEFQEKLREEYYQKLNTELAKLHSEGDKNSKFTQELALKMMEALPTSKTQVKVLSSGNEA